MAGVLLGIVLGTPALTEVITNSAAAVLIFPIAVAADTAAVTESVPGECVRGIRRTRCA